MKTLTVKFAYKTETKGAFRFEEVDAKGNVLSIKDGAIVGALYLRRDHVGDRAPKALVVTIEGVGKVPVQTAPVKEEKKVLKKPADHTTRKAAVKKKTATAAPAKSAAKKKAVKK